MQVIYISELHREVPANATLECPHCHIKITAGDRKGWVGCEPCRDEPDWVVKENG